MNDFPLVKLFKGKLICHVIMNTNNEFTGFVNMAWIHTPKILISKNQFWSEMDKNKIFPL